MKCNRCGTEDQNKFKRKKPRCDNCRFYFCDKCAVTYTAPDMVDIHIMHHNYDWICIWCKYNITYDEEVLDTCESRMWHLPFYPPPPPSYTEREHVQFFDT
jgi:hypothetical protein